MQDYWILGAQDGGPPLLGLPGASVVVRVAYPHPLSCCTELGRLLQLLEMVRLVPQFYQ